jgi:hypothetical protein
MEGGDGHEDGFEGRGEGDGEGEDHGQGWRDEEVAEKGEDGGGEAFGATLWDRGRADTEVGRMVLSSGTF